MKRKTYYFVIFDLNSKRTSKHFERKNKAFTCALKSQDKDYLIHKLTLLGIGARKGMKRRAWKKAKSTYCYSDEKIECGAIKGLPLNTL